MPKTNGGTKLIIRPDPDEEIGVASCYPETIKHGNKYFDQMSTKKGSDVHAPSLHAVKQNFKEINKIGVIEHLRRSEAWASVQRLNYIAAGRAPDVILPNHFEISMTVNPGRSAYLESREHENPDYHRCLYTTKGNRVVADIERTFMCAKKCTILLG